MKIGSPYPNPLELGELRITSDLSRPGEFKTEVFSNLLTQGGSVTVGQMIGTLPKLALFFDPGSKCFNFISRDPLRVVGPEKYLGIGSISGVEIRGVFPESPPGGVLRAENRLVQLNFHVPSLAKHPDPPLDRNLEKLIGFGTSAFQNAVPPIFSEKLQEGGSG